MFYFSKLTKKLYLENCAYYMALFRIRSDTFFSIPTGIASIDGS